VSQSWSGALGWRLRRQLLDPVGTRSAAEVVGVLGAVPATPDAAAEAMVRARQKRSEPGEIERALAAGQLIKTFAFRGAVYLATPADAAVFLALRAAGRVWERAGWRDHYNLEPADWPRLRAAVREALSGGPLTVAELAAAVTAEPRFGHLGPAFADRSATFLKPLAWQGDMSFGPPRDGRATFQRLEGNPRWPGLPDVDDAGPRAVEAYLRVYGPATADHLRYWLGNGLGAGRRRVEGWLAGLGDRLAEVDLDGRRLHVLRDDLPELLAAAPSTAVRLLPGLDPWVNGPGTGDAHIVPPARRAPVSRRASLVVAGGVVAGTWSLSGDAVTVDWFAEAGPVPHAALADEVARLAGTIARPLGPPQVRAA
jgi:Winged helix DNA-binding domain